VPVVKIPASLLRDEIIVEPYLGNTATGPTYAERRRVKARFEGRRRLVKTLNGGEVISTAAAIVRPEVDVQPESKVTFGDRTYDVVQVLRGEGLAHPSHFELVLA
jgi:hypothetical protein